MSVFTRKIRFAGGKKQAALGSVMEQGGQSTGQGIPKSLASAMGQGAGNPTKTEKVGGRCLDKAMQQ